MKRATARIRGVTVSPALVVGLLALLVALSGSAVAASKLIGSGAIKNNSLKSADLKNGAGVKGADVADGSLGGADVKDGALSAGDVAGDTLTGSEVSEASLAANRVVARLGGAAGVALPSGSAVLAVPNLSYTQAADQSNQFIAGGQVTFSSACTGTRTATLTLLKDSFVPTAESVVGMATVTDTSSGTRTRRFEFGAGTGPFYGNPASFRASAAQPHQFVVTGGVSCGGGSGATLDSLDLDVIGVG